MIHSVVEFGALNAGQLMVSRVDILSLDLDLPREEAIDLVIESGHSRIPVYRGSKDHIDGVLQARDFLVAWRRGEAEGIERFVRPPFFIPESMRVSTLFREFRARNERMAIVVDEYGGTAGIVTLEDVLGEIVGEIVDEDRDVALLAARRDGSVTVSGQIALDDLNDKAGLELPDEEFQTLSGLLVNHLGRVPYSGEEIALPGVVFHVLDADHRRIYRLAMKAASSEGPSAGVALRPLPAAGTTASASTRRRLASGPFRAVCRSRGISQSGYARSAILPGSASTGFVVSTRTAPGQGSKVRRIAR